jgi:hypothetical protein
MAVKTLCPRISANICDRIGGNAMIVRSISDELKTRLKLFWVLRRVTTVHLVWLG